MTLEKLKKDKSRNPHMAGVAPVAHFNIPRASPEKSWHRRVGLPPPQHRDTGMRAPGYQLYHPR
jgi:hypothetical protein